jgi:hypothetical protein
MAAEDSGEVSGLIVGRGQSLVIGGVGFSDASWVPHGLERARARKATAETFDGLVRLVFEGGAPYLAKAARMLAAASEESGRASVLTPEQLGACASGAPPSCGELRAIMRALAMGDPPDLPAGDKKVGAAAGVEARALKGYEDLARAVAFRMVFWAGRH